jgi:hypothetical protein
MSIKGVQKLASIFYRKAKVGYRGPQVEKQSYTLQGVEQGQRNNFTTITTTTAATVTVGRN